MEGDWSPSVVTIWDRKKGFMGFSGFNGSHPVHRPSLELYYEGAWIGIHCYQRVDNRNIFDEDQALRIINLVEKRLKSENE